MPESMKFKLCNSLLQRIAFHKEWQTRLGTSYKIMPVPGTIPLHVFRLLEMGGNLVLALRKHRIQSPTCIMLSCALYFYFI